MIVPTKITTDEKERNTAFEIMRLMAMFMIVLEHCLGATVLDTGTPLSAIDNTGWFIEAFTVCAVNLFFLLTGYFLKSGGFRLSRWLCIWIKTVFYSAIIYIIAVVTGMETFHTSTFVSYLCPVLLKKYWFMQTYIVLAVVLPFIGIMLERISEKQHLFLCVILLLFFSVHQTFIPVAKTLDATQGYGFIWGSALAIIGNWLNKYGRKYTERIKGALWLFGYFVIACGMWATNWLIVRYDIAQGITSRANFYAYNSISVFAESLCLFCFFIYLSEKNRRNRIVNWWASSVMSVYLISAHPIYIWLLWTDIFKVQIFMEKPAIYMGVIMFLSLAVMAVCILLDKLVCCLFKFAGLDSALRNLDNTKLNRLLNEQMAGNKV